MQCVYAASVCSVMAVLCLVVPKTFDSKVCYDWDIIAVAYGDARELQGSPGD